jgi:hypothetical protein
MELVMEKRERERDWEVHAYHKVDAGRMLKANNADAVVR